MIKFNILILFALAAASVSGMKHKNFCFLPCMYERSFIKETCSSLACPLKYPHKSFNGICSVNQNDYQVFTKWNFMLGRLKHGLLYDLVSNEYLQFVFKIVKCPKF